jgi:NAD(P)H-quinone oxidoreductase subunit 5
MHRLCLPGCVLSLSYKLYFAFALAPVALMSLAALWAWCSRVSVTRMWRQFNTLALTALVFSVAGLVLQLAFAPTHAPVTSSWLAANQFGAWVSLLVQLLGSAIGVYSSNHLKGEPRQPMYIAALAVVLAAVHLLLLADHWIVLIAAWAAIGLAMHHQLCFYKDRPF